jgi:hypothetical protein
MPAAVSWCIDNLPVPVITSVEIGTAGATSVIGTFTGLANTVYQIEVYASTSDNPGYGEYFLGFVDVLTDGTGVAELMLGGLIDPEPTTAVFISLTATSPDGTTSKFSSPAPATQID